MLTIINRQLPVQLFPGKALQTLATNPMTTFTPVPVGVSQTGITASNTESGHLAPADKGPFPGATQNVKGTSSRKG